MSDSRMASWPALPIDCHVHLFHPALRLAPGHRYAPRYSADPGRLRDEMAKARVGMAVVVQPSFLGCDNAYLLERLAADPSLAGIAVVPPGASAEELLALRRGGVVGLRLNCIGQPPPRLDEGPHRILTERAAEAGLVLEIQAERAQWRTIAPALPMLPGPVVIDHFGRTPPGDRSGGFEALIEAAQRTSHLWFKFSGPYRFASGAAGACADRILSVVGPGRIVWGSDWPWTQFEARHSYADTLAWLSEWLPVAADRHAVLTANPRNLFQGAN